MIAEVTAFDGEKAFQHLKRLAVTIGPRLTGSPGEHKAAAYITGVFRSLGLKVTQQRFPSAAQATMRPKNPATWGQIELPLVVLKPVTP